MNARTLGALAHAATLWEVHAAPKPGLVDRFGSGSHHDMDYSLFLRSAAALAPFWAEQARIGTDGVPPPAALSLLRARGVAMERSMFEATDGVNTHKGLVFVLSLLLYGAGRMLAFRPLLPGAHACRLAGAAAKATMCELDALRTAPSGHPLSHGERLYLRHGITGIRGEASRGFPSILNAGLPSLQKAAASGTKIEDAAIEALLHIMLVCEDSNVIYRGGFEFWCGEYRDRVATVVETTAPGTQERRTALLSLDETLRGRRVSPGGAADLLSGTLFLFLVDKTMGKARRFSGAG